MNIAFILTPAIVPITGTNWAAALEVTVMLNLSAIFSINRTRTGADCLFTNLLAASYEVLVAK